MTPDRWKQISHLYEAALARPASERVAYVEEACAGDMSLQREVQALLDQPTSPTGLEGLTPSAIAQAMGDESAPSMTGRRLGAYVVHERIGSGGMGVVYMAEDTRLHRRVALKLLRDMDKTSKRRLWREARTAARLAHPAICQLHDIREDDGQLYLVMELLEGQSLAERIAREPLPVPEAIEIMLAVLGALDFLHGKRFVHRDLKPSNIFLAAHGIKLLDFGLTRSLFENQRAPLRDRESAVTQVGMIAGTPDYMAPEQILGQMPDPRADVFAAGAILYELVAGRRPFERPDVPSVLHAVLHEQPKPLAGSPAIVAVDLIARRALAKDCRDRYDTAAEMADALRRCAGSNLAAAMSARPVTRFIALPFRLLRHDDQYEFLRFSLPDEISSGLAALGSLVVRSHLAAARYSNDFPDPRLIAQEAEVDVVLTGTLLRDGARLRVSAQLSDGPTGSVLWSWRAEFSVTDIFRMQDELVQGIVRSLSLPLTWRESRQLQKDVPASASAYEYYLRANQLGTDLIHVTEARDLYLKCVELDPQYAPAWARLGRCHRIIAKLAGDSGALEQADGAFRRALQLNPNLDLAHGLYAQHESDLGRASEAMVRLLQRVETTSNDPGLFAGLVHACRFCGLLDASIAAHHHARRLDPSIPTSVALSYFRAGDYRNALRAERVDVPFQVFALALLNRPDEALELLRSTPDAPAIPLVQVIKRSLLALLLGRRDESIALLIQLDRHEAGARGEEVYSVARLFAHLGDIERALERLHRSIDFGFVCYPAFARDPWLDRVRNDPRFTSMVHDAYEQHKRAEEMFVQARGMEILGLTVPSTETERA